MKVVSIVGMSGSGKSEVAKIFNDAGFSTVRFGDITDEEVKKQGLELNEANERQTREMLRKKHGMAAYAIMNVPRIETAREKSDVVIDGLYSWEEYKYLKEKYGSEFIVVAVWASPETRYARLAERKVRPLTLAEAAGRDHAEIESLNKGGPVAMADFTVANESSLADLKARVERVIAKIK